MATTRRSTRKLPAKYEQLDILQASHADIATRVLQDLMWRPYFSLSKKPRFKPIEWETQHGKVMITGAQPFGIATIWDADILFWCMSQIVEAKDLNEDPSPRVSFTPYQCLQDIGRETGGREYRDLMKSIQRLHNTGIYTTIRRIDHRPLTRAEERRLFKGFHWIENCEVEFVTSRGKETPRGLTIVFPNWLYRGVIEQKNVLTIDDRYFKLTGGLERALYLIARKHCGRQSAFPLTMRKLYEKMGSESPYKVFAQRIRAIVARDSLPEYCLDVYRDAKGGEVVAFCRRCELDIKDPRYEHKPMTKKQKRHISKETLEAWGEEW